jgi:hypothetical protein
VRLLGRALRKGKTPPLAVGKGGIAAYRNATSRGTYVYVELRPVARTVEYTLRLTAARR